MVSGKVRGMWALSPGQECSVLLRLLHRDLGLREDAGREGEELAAEEIQVRGNYRLKLSGDL